jgi:hypothetical protein
MERRLCLQTYRVINTVMKLNELTGDQRDRVEAIYNELNDRFYQKIAPAMKELGDHYAQQYPKPTWIAYTKNLEAVIKGWQTLQKLIIDQTDIRRKSDPNYRFPAVVIDTLTKNHAQMVKNSRLTASDINMNKATAGRLTYTDDPNDQILNSVRDKINQLVTALKGSFPPKAKWSKLLDIPKGTQTVVDPVQPAEPGTDISTNVKLKQIPNLHPIGTIDGELIRKGQEKTAGELEKFGQTIDGEWEVIDKTMKQLPDLRPKQLLDMRPKAGDYVMWTGGPRSSRPNQPNYGKVVSVRDNGVLNITSVNQQPNPSRQGREFGLNPTSIQKVIKKTDAQKLMPQQDPKKYRTGNAFKQGIQKVAKTNQGYKYKGNNT